MSDQHQPSRADEPSPFDELISGVASAQASSPFTTTFRGYEKTEVDAAIAELTTRVDAYKAELEKARGNARRAASDANAEQAARIEQLEAELSVEAAKATTAEQKVQALTEEIVGGESTNRHQFEEVLHVAEEQASVLIKNATVQADRLMAAAHEEIQSRRNQTQAEAAAILSRAESDASQVRLRIDTEATAHRAEAERQAQHAAEKVAQAEQEAAAIRTEAEKGAAALRSLVARETAQARAEAEEAVRELQLRVLEFEESLTRRQNDAQQEFLMLHNQAVAHAERITQDANDQVGASLEHAQRITAKADDFDKLMRAQAAQIEADANIRSREQLDRARIKAQKIIDTVTGHSQAVLRDAEDRSRQLRWQQQQLTSFMSEVSELMRLDAALDADAAAPAADATEADSADDAE